ncbi:hypothetical protein DDE83_000268 [Stemphylium lycopersici]|uniref:SRR1-like domain-containing protein n=1 Tax=Stemphylium lycopersici TaxID=183478 RepID=A0A364NGD2_STELY|nr:hypothetical protein DDE83_000268 [Stemphylium lycopersici]
MVGFDGDYDSESLTGHVEVYVNAFEESLNGHPVFTRKVFENARQQLNSIGDHEHIELYDHEGRLHTIPAEDGVRPDHKNSILRYHSLHALADTKKHHVPCPDLASDGNGGIFGELKRFSRFPVYISHRAWSSHERYSSKKMLQIVSAYSQLWNQSVERKMLVESLHQLIFSVRISNIVCIGHGSLSSSTDSLVQHLAACTIAQELQMLYKEADGEFETTITITSHEPSYNRSDKEILSRLPIPISIQSDHASFLDCLNDSSLVMSISPEIPVKQIIADLSSEPAGKIPAALFVSNRAADDENSQIDPVRYTFSSNVCPLYCTNPETKRYTAMLELYTKIMDGQELFGAFYTEYEQRVLGEDTYSEKWEGDMEAAAELVVEHPLVECNMGIQNDYGIEVKEDADCSASQLHSGVHASEQDPQPEVDSVFRDADPTKDWSGFAWLRYTNLWARHE